MGLDLTREFRESHTTGGPKINRGSKAKPLLEALDELGTSKEIIARIYTILGANDKIAEESKDADSAMARSKEEIPKVIQEQLGDKLDSRQMRLVLMLAELLTEEDFRGRLSNVIGTGMQ
ncbi:hypothetical protein JW758_04635 [Candidatus Peregrinibacteria bacterium]|nr:hypothetical protein [Candidatus Peregrinibacteria bacterium]